MENIEHQDQDTGAICWSCESYTENPTYEVEDGEAVALCEFCKRV